jgi:hypothetical protein
MATIASIIRSGKGTAHAWRVERDGTVATLVHYATPMLRWDVRAPRESHTVLSTGWGSVSDQNGMNTAFDQLGIPRRYDRDARGGGPRVTELCTCGSPSYPHRDGACAPVTLSFRVGGDRYVTVKAAGPVITEQRAAVTS